MMQSQIIHELSWMHQQSTFSEAHKIGNISINANFVLDLP